ncbi:hypothetical protein EGR_09095 [Echinococcus granulosus]|uniref:Uncharacterized protein n=1 Tax=Echinococcus granulosus TaxID=6210 RepID=W6UCP3_ECHGR|nr:hypothetical protein EGR_09095 [Echinococcus granulosus]EUB56057.1 hypothetical protein EGR_09095 [Echinococcus granulosus]
MCDVNDNEAFGLHRYQMEKFCGTSFKQIDTAIHALTDDKLSTDHKCSLCLFQISASLTHLTIKELTTIIG